VTLRSVALGCGSYLPQQILTNAELATRPDTSDEWIGAADRDQAAAYRG
jgi:3-oxoacyl-[acyl-carrier-protein] synthase-3